MTTPFLWLWEEIESDILWLYRWNEIQFPRIPLQDVWRMNENSIWPCLHVVPVACLPVSPLPMQTDRYVWPGGARAFSWWEKVLNYFPLFKWFALTWSFSFFAAVIFRSLCRTRVIRIRWLTVAALINSQENKKKERENNKFIIPFSPLWPFFLWMLWKYLSNAAFCLFQIVVVVVESHGLFMGWCIDR